MLEWRLKAYRHWLTMKEPHWANVHLRPDRLPGDRATTRRRSEERPKSLDEVDPEILEDLREARHPACKSRKCSRAWRSTRCSTRSRSPPPSRASSRTWASSSARSRRRCGASASWCGSTWARWCRTRDNFFATLNSAVFTDGSFVYVPKGVRCPMELSTYFRINARNTGQFERTLIIADEGAYVSYLEGCTAPMRDENQLHAAVVELVALERRPDQVLDGAELVPGRQGTARAASSTSSPSAASARARMRRSPGPRSRPARRSPGSTRR